MSEIVENVSGQNSAQSGDAAAAQPTEIVEAVTTNNVEAVPVAVDAGSSASIAIKNSNDELSKQATELSTSPNVDSKRTPVKRTPSKRMSYIERAQKESEELVKNMGGSLEMEGGRRTRSSTRGTPTRSAVVATPPPAKKARSSPASGASTPTRPRARGRKIDTAEDVEEGEEILPTPSKKKPSVKGKKATTEEANDEKEVLEKPEELQQIEKKSEDGKSKSEDKLDSSESKEVELVKLIPEQKVSEKQEEDDTDAILEPVTEETLSQVAATEAEVTKEPKATLSSNAQVEDEVIELTESVKSDSPMETDEVKSFESVTEKKDVIQAVETEKQPTPEPMEVDSSSKSNDAVEETEVVINKVLPGSATTSHGINLYSVEKAEKIVVQQNSVERIATASLANIVVANNSMLNAKTEATEPVAPVVTATNEKVTEESTTPAANDSTKTEHDLCEPKIATSPSITSTNDTGSVATPQTCN